jgi:uncharacterized protein (DUF433 family)
MAEVDWRERIVRDPAVMTGKPCIRGTRITVELILRETSAGDTTADLIESYPQLTQADVLAAFAYAADYMQREAIIAA